ncbi:MAG: valine--tRNA ligase [Planctomycetes bacterium]|nr:valine--tRNA ligase [Planctomycetota bacterium]
MTESSKPSSGAQGSGGPIGELPKQYKPADHEQRIRAQWDEAKAFHADPQRVLRGEAKPYCIVIPPPNVTDRLHLGHALNNTLQDVLARSHRMMGFETLWMAGTDHAGIATQAVVERRLKKEEGITRQQLGREKFVAKVQAFKDEYEKIITDQLKLMGCSCDWDRQRFTMDEVCARAVREAFFRLFKDGLIYRGKRLVNWDPVLQTAVADDECYDEEIDSSFYYLRYPLVHRDDPKEDAQPVTWNELARRGYPGAEKHRGEEQAWVTVATTRPETYLGDTAVAVNPKDPRANGLRGLFVELPLVGRIIPILEDDYVVLPASLENAIDFAPREHASDAPASAGAAPSAHHRPEPRGRSGAPHTGEGSEPEDPKAKYATGFLKVTPAHDPNDYELGLRHTAAIEACGNAVLINMLAPDGTVSDKHGWSDVGDAHLFVGLPREKARKKVIEEFAARTLAGSSTTLLAETRPYRHSVKHSDRSKAIIEPYLSDQWYVKVTDDRLAPAANRALVAEQRSKQQSSKQQIGADGDGELRFYPARYAKTYEQWHDGIRDWCISRQLWWGHRVPVWSMENAPPEAIQWLGLNRDSVCVRTIGTLTFACVNGLYNAAAVEKRLHTWGFGQDTDVLDTWFSSALWPISTMGWPNPQLASKGFEGLLQAFNPTTTLCTAREIITLWVSRMVMFERYLMPERWETEKTKPNALASLDENGQGRGPLPFKNVFIHAVIQDGEGRKMSKSLGNGLDPLDIIASHGSDAMRFTLCQMTTQTQDVRMPMVKDPATGRNTSPKFDLGRNFANKLWNAARFTMSMLGATSHPTSDIPHPTSLIDRWMLSRLATATSEVNEAITNFEYSNYAQTMYDLLWRDFCDWYLEAIKPTIASDVSQQAVLRTTLECILRLLHPIMPYVTEAVYEQVKLLSAAPIPGIALAPPRKGGLLCTAGWPQVAPSLRQPAVETDFERLRSLITVIREVRAQHGVVPKRRITLHVPVGTLDSSAAALVQTLAGVESISAETPGAGAVAATSDALKFQLSNLRDAASAADSGAERERLQKLIADHEKSIATLEGRLNNPGYAQKAPPAMVKQTQDQLAKAKAERDAAKAALAVL